MTSPTDDDRRATSGKPAARMLGKADRTDPIWCYSPLQEVQRNMDSTGYPASQVTYVKGKVEDTIPGAAPEQI